MKLDDDGWYTDEKGDTWAPAHEESYPDGTETKMHNGILLFNVEHAADILTEAYFAAKREGRL
ncbi:hypothetical protein [Streptomyces albidoflavus]|uniref:hypothetical protein n=1 Tax=Streptomyces albidoflavus TaxID=1886 RepID=UPI003405CDB0